MRFTVLAIGLLFAFIAPGPVLAEDATGRAKLQRQQAVNIEEDQDSKAFRFMIDGQEIARLDATGLHVRKGISYGGSLTDYDPIGFDAYIAQKAKVE